MAILIRSHGGKWQNVAKVEFANESQLQNLLYTSPELVTEDTASTAVFTREAGLPGSGYTDLLGVDSDGNILVVETKLARNREVRRTVIGQVMEYAAYLWQMPFEQFDGFFISREGKSVLELLSGKAPDIDKEELRQRIASNLASGDFDLLIGVDEINPELDKIIAYLSSREQGLKFEAMEFEAYRHGELDLLVPHRHGQIDVKSPKSGRRTQTIEQVIDGCKDDHSRRLLQAVVHQWTTAGNNVVPGTVGASFRANVSGEEEVIFWAYPDSLQAGFSVLKKEGAPSADLDHYRQTVSQIAGFNPSSVLTGAQPITKWASLDEDATNAFLKETERFVHGWRNARATAAAAR